MILQQQQVKVVDQKKKEREEEQQKVEEHILKRYELNEFKGKGAYGIVWKATDRKTKQSVALKKVFDAFHNSTDAQRTFREVIYLEQLTQHDNIVKLLSVIRAENDRDLYMVFEYMETDLHKVIRAGILESIHKKYITYQLLKSLKYIHSGELIHRDLKPSNLLIDAQCKIKVADFGLARSLHQQDDDTPVMTEYVATRWYRAPEILLGSQNYSKAVDMWSVGCILGEMIVGRALFPGNSTLNQIERVIELIGRPKPNDYEAMQAPLAQNIIANISTQKKKVFAQLFNGVNDDCIDFIRKCLVYDPQGRLTVEGALKHPYIKEFSGSEPEIRKDNKIFSFMNDNQKYSVKEYRSALYNHINSGQKVTQKSLSIKVQKIPESRGAQSNSGSQEKTEQKQLQKNQPQTKYLSETNENVATIKRYTETKNQMDRAFDDDYQVVPIRASSSEINNTHPIPANSHLVNSQSIHQNNQKKFYHTKSQSQSYLNNYIVTTSNIKSGQEVFLNQSQQAMSNNEEPSMEPQPKIIKKHHRRLLNARTGSMVESQNLLPAVENSPAKPLTRNGSLLEKKLMRQTMLITPNQQVSQHQNGPNYSSYFLSCQNTRKNSFVSQKTSQFLNNVVSQEKLKGEQIKNYISVKQVVGSVAINAYQNRIKQKK